MLEIDNYIYPDGNGFALGEEGVINFIAPIF